MQKIILMVLAICVIALPTYAAIDTNNIMGMWLFNQDSGGTAVDSSENGNDGTIHGAKLVDGVFGKALEFDGTDDWVEVPHAESLGFPAGTSFSITLHYKGTKVGGSLVGKNYEDTTQELPWYLLWNGGQDDKIGFFLRDDASTSFRMNSTTGIADDQWYFIAGRADAATGKGTLWINGNQEAEFDFNTSSAYGTSEGVLHIGRHFNRYTAGIIDDVALFNIALSEDEMNDIMNNGIEDAASVELINKLTTTWGKIKRQTQQ